MGNISQMKYSWNRSFCEIILVSCLKSILFNRNLPGKRFILFQDYFTYFISLYRDVISLV